MVRESQDSTYGEAMRYSAIIFGLVALLVIVLALLGVAW